MYNKFFKDPYLILHHCLTSVVIFGILAAVVGFIFPPDFHWTWYLLLVALMAPRVSIWYLSCIAALIVFMALNPEKIDGAHLLVVIVAVGIGALSAAVIHNAAHKAFSPKWINRILGELCSFHQLNVYPVWYVAHFEHHKNPDDLERDPHPPGNKSFIEYLWPDQSPIARYVAKLYDEKWIKKDAKYKRIWQQFEYSAILLRLLRLVFLLLLLKPEFFVCFYLPSYIGSLLLFGHLNYYTHKSNADGTTEILDLNHNLYYKTINFLFFGCYFHKTHHEQPRACNPMHYALKAGMDNQEAATS